MKRRICGVLVVLSLATIAASGQEAVPRLLSVQGRIAATDGMPLEGNQQVIFTIWDVAIAGNVLWTSSDNSIGVGSSFSFSDGVFSAQLGRDDTNNPIDLAIFSMPNAYI